MFHYRKTRKRYASYPKPELCHFCDRATLQTPVSETQHAIIIPNRTFYDLWELRKVTDHLMVIPKRHVRSLSELNEAERLDIMKILGDYEDRGYNIYARSVGSVQRSVSHQHTHLIKTASHSARFYMFMQKPYWMIKF